MEGENNSERPISEGASAEIAGVCAEGGLRQSKKGMKDSRRLCALACVQ